MNFLQYVTVEPILFLYMLLIRMESNAIQELIYVKSCLKVLHPVNASICNYGSKENVTEALKEATVWGEYNFICLSFFALLTGFYVASWSDRIGRRVVMLIPVIGTLIAATINCFLSMHLETPIPYLFISTTISGLSFGTVGMFASTFGYIADLTTEDKRTKRIIVLESMSFLGGPLGIEIGGLFLKNIDFNSSFNNFSQLFAFEMCVAAVILSYTLIRIPSQLNYRVIGEHSLPSTISCSSLFSIKHVVESFRTIFKERPEGKRMSILLLLLALIFVLLGFSANISLAYYFVKNKPLEWSFSKYSTFNSIQTAVQGLTLLIGLPIALHFFKLPDHAIGILGTLSRIAGFVVYGLSKTDTLVYSTAAFFMFSEYATPTIRSLLSKKVDINEKGKIFAFTSILQSLCHLCGSFIFSSLFKSTINTFPGLSFELVAVLHLFTLFIFCFLFVRDKQRYSSYEIYENDNQNAAECQIEPSTVVN